MPWIGDSSFVGCCTMSVSEYLLIFQRIIVPSEKMTDYFYRNQKMHYYIIKVQDGPRKSSLPSVLHVSVLLY